MITYNNKVKSAGVWKYFCEFFHKKGDHQLKKCACMYACMHMSHAFNSNFAGILNLAIGIKA